MPKNKIVKLMLLVVFFCVYGVFAQQKSAGIKRDPAAKVDSANLKNNIKWNVVNLKGFIIYYTDKDAGNFMNVMGYVSNGMKTVEKYFGKPYPKTFSVYVYPDRQKMDKHWQEAWGVPGFKSQCWMVASGVAERLDLLSPTVWKTEACEHDASDKDATQKLITHELVHVYQGQNSPNPDFTGMDDMGWFVEGLATFVSGQLDKARLARTKAAVKKGEYPKELNNAWSGKNRYGIAGSMVNYINTKYGKDTMTALLKVTSKQVALKILKTTENNFINNWTNWLLNKK